MYERARLAGRRAPPLGIAQNVAGCDVLEVPLLTQQLCLRALATARRAEEKMRRITGPVSGRGKTPGTACLRDDSFPHDAFIVKNVTYPRKGILLFLPRPCPVCPPISPLSGPG